MVTPMLRCHLLIGPPASGKTTLAAVLAELVGGQVLSTDAIRTELYGDAAIQGAWCRGPLPRPHPRGGG
jgi:predicted kinase